MASQRLSEEKETVFTVLRANALWRNEMSDEKHEEIRRLSSALILKKNRKVFQPLLFSSSSVKEHVKEKQDHGHLDMYRNCRYI